MQKHDNKVENKDDVGEYETIDDQPNIQCGKVFFSIDIYLFCYWLEDLFPVPFKLIKSQIF